MSKIMKWSKHEKDHAEENNCQLILIQGRTENLKCKKRKNDFTYL